MARFRIPEEDRDLRDAGQIAAALAAVGIEHERWEPAHPVGPDASAEEVLRAYSREIESIKNRGGYVTADVVDVTPQTPGIEEMRAKFQREHWHDEDEVRFILHGTGHFFIRPRSGAVLAIEVEPGDLIRIPGGTWHWFELCPEPEIRAIRLFQDPAGWTPRYTDSGAERAHEPVCLGPAFVAAQGGGELTVAAPVDEARTRIILLDIEGTTTPISFVYDVLFPYARANLVTFFRGTDPDRVQAQVEALRRERLDETGEGDPPPWRDASPDDAIESAIAYVGWLMDRDRKSTALKSLQGKIWSEGFQNGVLGGAVYADVPAAFKRWNGQGRTVGIFSSGSILAQALLFAHSTAGDLTPYLAHHFDTTTGPKKEAESYRKIAAALGHPAGEVLFVSDVVEELDAAREAGMQTVLCIRPGARPPDGGTHTAIRSLEQVLPGS